MKTTLQTTQFISALLIVLVLISITTLFVVPDSAQGIPLEGATPVVFWTPVPISSIPAPHQEGLQTTEIIVDDLDSGFSRQGPSSSWQESSSTDSTFRGHAYWTYATDEFLGSQNNSASWTAQISQSGEYEVLAYIPAVVTGRPDTTRAEYWVFASAFEPYRVEVDQSNNERWASLGTFTFDAGAAEVRLRDITEDWSYQGQRKTILFDAVKWVRTDSSPPPDGGENYVYNPSFELGVSNPYGWDVFDNSLWDSSTAHIGSRSARTSGAQWKSYPFYLPAGTYYFGLWHKDTDEVEYAGAWLGPDGGPYWNLAAPAVGDGAWHYHEQFMEINYGYSDMRVWLVGSSDSGGIPQPGSSGTVWYDDIWLSTSPWSGGNEPRPVNVSIWVDRGEGATYYVGEQLRLCYSVSRPIYVKVYDCQPGQSCRVVIQGDDDGQGDCRNYTVNEPTGREVVRIEAIENGQVVAEDDTYFYVEQSPQNYYSISGRVVDSNDNPLAGVTVSDGNGHTDSTDSNGNYTLNSLPAGTYIITPSKADYTFSPTSRMVTVPPDATGQDFTGEPTSQESGMICGQILLATTCDGRYLRPIFTPCGSDAHYLWEPASFDDGAFYRISNPTFEARTPLCTREYGDVTNRLASWSGYEEITSCEVCGSPPPSSAQIAGTVRNSDNIPIEGVTVSLDDGLRTDQTDAQGHYVLHDVPAGTYTVLV